MLNSFRILNGNNIFGFENSFSLLYAMRSVKAKRSTIRRSLELTRVPYFQGLERKPMASSNISL